MFDPKGPAFILLVIMLTITTVYLARDYTSNVGSKDSSLFIVESIESKLNDSSVRRLERIDNDTASLYVSYIDVVAGKIAEDYHTNGILLERRYYSGKSIEAINKYAANMLLVKREYFSRGRIFAIDFFDFNGNIMVTEYYDSEGRVDERTVAFLPPFIGTAMSG